MPAVAIVHREIILQRVARGDLIRNIAPDLGVTPAAICNILAADPAYQAARQVGALQQIERWQNEIEHAADALTVSRAREGFRAAAWRAEREFPAIWGQHTQLNIDISEQLGDLLQRLSERKQGRLIDAQQSIEAESVVKNVVTPRDGEDDAQSDQ